MSKKEALRELQSRLADRLQAARDQAPTATWLAVEAAGRGFLLPLAEAGEIFTGRVSCLPVPHTAPWLLGVANLRGHLHSVVDLAAFLGLRGISPTREANCLVAFNPQLDTNCALLVDRLAGLRGRDQMRAQPAREPVSRPSFAAGSWSDEQGRVWQELALGALSRHEAFLGVAA